MTPRTEHKLRSVALAFFALGLWLAIVALIPRAVEQRLQAEEAAARPSVEAMSARAATEAVNAAQDAGDGQTNATGANSGTPEVAKRVIRATVFTYQAVPEQTDSTPCITADGLDLCDPLFVIPPFGVVASNCLPFGTEVEIRGDSYFVHDRMKKGTPCNVFDVLTGGENWATPKGTTEPVTVL